MVAPVSVVQILRACCIAMFTQIPSLPSKTLISNDEETIEYRQTSFQSFLNFVIRHKSLVYSPELLAFLKLPDSEFEKYREKTQYTSFVEPANEFMNKGKSKLLASISTPTGIIEGRLDAGIRKLARDISVLVVDTSSQFEDAVQTSKQIEQHLKLLSECYQKLANQVESIACKFNLVCETNKFESFGRIGGLYSSMSESLFVQSVVTRDESLCFGKDIKMMFDFDLKELDGLEEVQHCKLVYGKKELFFK